MLSSLLPSYCTLLLSYCTVTASFSLIIACRLFISSEALGITNSDGEKAVEKAVKETEVKATAKGLAEGTHDRAIVSILRILNVRFGIDAAQQDTTRLKLDSVSDLSKLDEVEDRALLAFTFAEFTGHLDSLLASQHRNGSAR